MIALPRPWLLCSVMLIGAAAGALSGVGVTLLASARVRPDVVIGLVLGMPTVAGLALILFSARRWASAAGAFLVALAPGWFAALVAIQAVSGA